MDNQTLAASCQRRHSNSQRYTNTLLLLPEAPLQLTRDVKSNTCSCQETNLQLTGELHIYTLIAAGKPSPHVQLCSEKIIQSPSMDHLTIIWFMVYESPNLTQLKARSAVHANHSILQWHSICRFCTNYHSKWITWFNAEWVAHKSQLINPCLISKSVNWLM